MLIIPIFLGLLFFYAAPRTAVFLATLGVGAFFGALGWVIGLIGGWSSFSLGSLGMWMAIPAGLFAVYAHWD